MPMVLGPDHFFIPRSWIVTLFFLPFFSFLSGGGGKGGGWTRFFHLFLRGQGGGGREVKGVGSAS